MSRQCSERAAVLERIHKNNWIDCPIDWSMNELIDWLISSFVGEISTRVSLDRERRAVYEVSVEVADEGQPPQTARATVRVLVTDVNDNSPTFIEPREASVSIREEQPAGTEVLQVQHQILLLSVFNENLY